MIKAVVSALLVLCFLAAPSAAQTSQNAEAEKFVQDLIDQGVGILQNDSVSLEKKKQVFGSLVLDNTDIRKMALFTLGRYRRAATDEQINEFVSLFEQYTRNFYETRLGEYNGEQIKVTGSVVRDENDTVVSSEMDLGGGSPLAINWRIENKNGKYIIRDIGVAGIWLVLEQRAQFTSVISNNGGQVDALLKELRSMVASGEGINVDTATN